MIIAFLPWLDRSPVKSIRKAGPIFRGGGDLRGVLPDPRLPGRVAADPMRTLVSQICSFYFGFFLLMPWYSKLDKCKPEPERVTSK